ncbi:MAG: hypothetical protein ACFFD2_21735, partial [Promethearchaeota archaeon]
MKANAEEKPKPGPEKWVKIQKGWNVFRVILNIIILGGLITIIVGNYYNNQVAVLQWYLLGFISMYPLLVLFDAINDSRAAFLDGKWEIKNGEEEIEPKKFAPNWSRILPEPLLLGIVVAFPIFSVFFLFGTTINPIVGMVVGAIISFIPTFIITNFWLKRHLHEDLISFAAAVQNPKQEQPEPFMRYYFLEHFLPWAVIVGIMNLGINIKNFLEKEIIYEGT